MKNRIFRISLILFFVFCLIYTAVAFLLIKQPQGPKGGTRGDEPHYLVISYSLWKDRDLDLTNNYENRDWYQFHKSRDLDPHVGKGREGQMYPLHGLGLSLFILPFYILLGVLGVRISLGFCTALLISNIFLFSFEVTKNKNGSLWITCLLGISAPLITHSVLIFPEIMAGLIILWIVRKIYLFSNLKPRISHSLLVGICLGLLPWLHVKYLIVVFVLTLFIFYYFYRQRVKREIYVYLIIPLLIFSFSLMNYFYHFYKSILPNAAYQSIEHPTLFSGNPMVGILGSFFDQERGLFINAPIYILAIWGAVFLWKRERELTLLLGSIIIPYFILISSFRDWMGGWSPASRYLVPLVGLLSVFIGECFIRLKRLIFFRLIFYLFVLWGLLLVSLIPFTFHFGYGDWLGENEALQVIRENTGINLAYLFPSFIFLSLKSYLLSLLFIMIIILLGIYFSRLVQKSSSRN